MISYFEPWSAALFPVTGALLVLGIAVTVPRRPIVRVILGAIALIAFSASPKGFDAVLHHIANAREAPGLIAWSPMMFSVLVVLVAVALFPRSARWRAAFAAVAFTDAALNLVNTCNPGWCGRWGFPFAYSWWSDAMIEFNGQNLSSGTSSLAVVANVLVLLAVGYGMSLYSKRTAASASHDEDPQRFG